MGRDTCTLGFWTPWGSQNSLLEEELTSFNLHEIYSSLTVLPIMLAQHPSGLFTGEAGGPAALCEAERSGYDPNKKGLNGQQSGCSVVWLCVDIVDIY